MPSLKYDIIVDGNQSRIALQQFANETDAAFKKSERAISRISMAALPEHEQAVLRVHRQYQALEAQMRQLEKSGRITKDQASKWSSGLTAGMDREILSIKSMGNESAVAAGKVKQFDRNLGGLTGNILAAAPAFAIATAAIAGVYEAVSLVIAELKVGFNAVEDYRNSVLQMAAVMTTFSQKAKDGDLAGGWKDSHAYAGQLISDLEIIDAKSAASGENIRDMVLSLTNHRVMVNTNLKGEQEAVIALANTIKALTGTQQNANLQYTQEINALMTGMSRPGDRLVQNLEAAGLNTKKFAQDLKQGKATIADIIPYLSGFKAASDEIAGSWDAVWSTIKTVNNRILRGGFEPIVDDIKNLGKEIIGIYTDQNGQLNEQAKTLQRDIRDGWQTTKDLTKEYGPQLLTILEYLAAWKVSQLAINVLVGKNPYVMVAAGVAVLNESLHKYNLGLQDTTQSAAELATNIKNIYEVIKGERDANTGFSADDLFGPKNWTGQKSQPPALADAAPTDDDLKALQKTREEWEKTVASLSKQVTLGGLTGLAKELRQLNIEHADTVAKFKGFDTSEIDRFYEELAGQARLDSIKKIDTDLKSFFEDIDSFGKEAGLDNTLTDFFTGLDETAVFLQKQRELIEDLSTAALPEHARQIEEVTKKYREYDRVLSDLVSSGAMSFEDATKLDLGLSANWQAEMDGIENITLDTTKSVSEFWNEAQRDMQSTSKTFFFDLMKGNFDDLGSQFEDMILNMVANWEAAQLQMALWGGNASASGGLGNGLISAGVSALFPSYAQNAGIDAALSSYFNFAKGGVMTDAGPLPLRKYAAGGVANSPQMAIYGEGSKSEAFVPLEDGRSIPVTMNGGASVQVNIINNASGAQATANERTDGGGNRIIDILVEQVESKMGSNIGRGKGLAPVLKSVYGLNSAWGMNR